ncbi:MAG: site-2 protease family protein [Acidobacteria bacterium]|nr:site-2 protease family protein [Acidobacteriota bacterium]
MKWSWKLGEVAGIAVYMHATFLILVGWVALSYWQAEHSVTATLAGVVFILALFGCVLLHELGHALTAKHYGIRTRDITLLPIGGLARLERMPDDPRQELWVALAGPAVNVVIGAALLLLLQLTGGLEPLSRLSVTGGSFLQRLMVVNVFLAVFNMLPAFPMDGGRVLRAALATRMDYVQATQIAAHLGQGMAFLFGFIGFFGNPFLLFIALFVWIGAAQEASMVQMKSALGGIPVNRAMLTDFRALSPGDTLGHAVELILSGSQQDFPVVESEAVVGVLTRADLLVALAQQGKEVLVRDVMQREFQIVDSSEMLETALTRLQECACHTLPVMRSGRLVGLVTMDNVGEFLSIQAALGTTKGERRVESGFFG